MGRSMKKWFRVCFGGFLSLAALTQLAFGLEAPTLRAKALSHAPKIDGQIEPDEWKEAAHVTGFVDPVIGASAAEQTEVWLGYDIDAVYVAFRAIDSDPSGLVGREIKPGSWFDGEDTVTFRLNTFGTRGWDGRSRFTVNVLNTQSDDIAGGRAAKREWRGDWQSQVVRLKDGYSVEMRIPWKVLNYPVGRDLSMDVLLERYQARTHVFSRWPDTTRADKPELSLIWKDINPPARSERNRIQFLGYTAPEYDHVQTSLRSGLDARYAFTPTLTGLVSLNPDFRNIEQQIAGIDFTRTERFLDDARPFFNEGGGFTFVGSEFGFGRMFYSWRLPQFDYGAKTFGQITPTLSLGALSTVATNESRATVLRLGKTFGPKANMNLFYTGYDGLNTHGEANDKPNVKNETYGGSFWARKGNVSLDGNMALSHFANQGTLFAGDTSLSYDAPKVFSLLRYEWIPADFDPSLAYIPWKNRKGLYSYSEANCEYRGGPLRFYHGEIYVRDFRTYTNDPQENGFDVSSSVLTRGDTRIGANTTVAHFAGALDSFVSMWLRFNASNRFRRFGFSMENGKRADIPSKFVSADGSFRLWKRMDLGLSRSVYDGDGLDKLTIATVGYEFSPTRAITGRVVERNGETNAYLAYRNSGALGTEYYLILGDPNAASTVSRVSVKLVWAF